MENKEFDFLPTIALPPNPPSDSGDREQWQKHITAMDKYILDMNRLIQEMEHNDFAQRFKERLEQKGIDIERADSLPKTLLEEIAAIMSQVLNKFKQAELSLGRVHTKTHAPKQKHNRNIRSI